jgi:hypothetical protein
MAATRVCALVFFAAVVAHGLQLGAEPHVALIETNPMEKAPLVGEQFKVHPVATSINCVVNLTIQYFVIYTALAICRTAADVWNLKYEQVPIQKILQTAALTVNYAPMLSVLFLAVRMRVTWLTLGRGNPQEWVQMWMYCCTYAVLLMTLIVCVIPLFTGEVIGVDQKTGDIKDDEKPFDNFILAGCFTVLKYLIMIGLYVGACAIIYGAYTYVPPKELAVHEGETPPVAPAVACTFILSAQFFICYACVQFSRTFSQFSGVKMSSFENAMLTATKAMNFAPMLAILFIGARMRALQMDPINGSPQKWAQNCFYMCTYAVLAQTLISIAIPLVLNGSVKKGKAEGDMEYTIENKALGGILSFGRYIIMICIYVGFSCVIYSIFTIEHPKGAEYTPPISVTMQCVINLTFQFFFIYLMIWVCISVDEFTGHSFPLIKNTMENALGTVAYCPMLAILFVATRMRALRITNNKGAPPGWAQDGMYMATWAVLIQFLMVLIIPCCTGSTDVKCDEDGTPMYKPENPIALYCVLALKWITYIFLYGGVIAVITAVYTMTPETANGRGSVPLIGDGKVPGTETGVPGYDGVKEPYGVNDAPGVSF